jgi:hypothetical protein
MQQSRFLMPWIAPSHQAPVLPLKMWKPRLFSGLALCIGAAAPDLEFILRLDHDWIVSHTFAAQVFFTVPLVMLLHLLATSLVIPWLLPLLPRESPWHFHDLGVLRPAATPREWTRVAFSGFVGGVSHVAVDGFTHGNHSGWAADLLPVLRLPIELPIGPIPVHDLLQCGLTVVLGIATLQALADMARRRLLIEWAGACPLPVREATAGERVWVLQYVLFCAALGVVAGSAAHQAGAGPWLELAAHGLLAFVFYGVLLAAAADRVRTRRPPTVAAAAK